MQEHDMNSPEINQPNTGIEATSFQTYEERLKKAFEGKEDLRLVVRAIKPQFPEIRLADLSLAVSFIQEGMIQDEEILKAIEAI